MQLHQLAPLALEVADPTVCERFQRPTEPAAALPRILRNAALLAAIARQKHNDAIRLAELVGPQNQRIGGVERHPEAGSYATSDLAPGGETPAASGEASPLKACVAPPSSMADILSLRAFFRDLHGADCAPWGRSAGRRLSLSKGGDFRHRRPTH